ncbi:Transcription factor, partial [Datura stramonium]|nr:Transcription factor [Datura stramonium]
IVKDNNNNNNNNNNGQKLDSPKSEQRAYDEEESAATAYDLIAIKYWGTSTFTNFSISDYEKEIEIMKNMTKEEHLASLRRRSSGFSRGVSKYIGVARFQRWKSRFNPKEETSITLSWISFLGYPDFICGKVTLFY